MTRPSIGARFVWTSNIDKKIPTRRVFVFNTWFSSDSVMSITVPSAAATIRFGFAGTVRSGSRQNATVNRNSSKQNQNIHAKNNPQTTASSAEMPKIHLASKMVCRRIKGLFSEVETARSRHQKWPKVGSVLNHNIISCFEAVSGYGLL